MIFRRTYPNLKVKWTKYSTDEMKTGGSVASAAGRWPILVSTGAGVWVSVLTMRTCDSN